MKNILDHFELEEDNLEEWRLFIGPHAAYYVQEWLKIKTGNYFSFNLSALVFGVFWLLYRKMFRPAILYLSVYFAEGYLESLLIDFRRFPIPFALWTTIRLLLYSISLGFLGNWFYYLNTQRKLKLFREQYRGDALKQILKSKGGVSFFPVFVLILFILVLMLSQYYFVNAKLGTLKPN